MDVTIAIQALAALAQETRLAVFRLLVQHEPLGLAAGDIARRLGVPHNTMSAHLGALGRAGLVRSTRQSRSIIYRADIGTVRRLVSFLLDNCCGGQAEACGAEISDLVCCSEEGPDHE
jgi:DNA-binding transcriptional ArsR family regulator